MSTSDASPPAEKQRLSPGRVAAATMVGTMIEAYDLVLYSMVAATVFSHVFFPDIAPWLGTLAALASHAVAFFMRPFGAILFGYIGDRFSRVKALRISLLLMGTATLLIGLLPTADQIGILAPILLVTMRLLQGLAMGGEYGGAVAVSMESAPPARRALYGTFPNTGSILGAALAITISVAMLAILGTDALLSWGWRIAFLLSVVLVFIGFLVRRIQEPEEFEESVDRKADGQGGPPLGRKLRLIGIATLLLTPNTLIFYLIITSFLAYVRAGGVPGLSVQAYQLICCAAMVVSCAVNIGGGFLSLRVSRHRIVLAACISAIVASFPAILLLQTGKTSLALIGIVILIPAHGLMSGVATSYVSDALPVQFRYTGVGLGYALGAGFGSGFLPLAILWLIGPTGALWPFAFLICLSCLGAIAGVVAVQRSTRQGAKLVGIAGEDAQFSTSRG